MAKYKHKITGKIAKSLDDCKFFYSHHILDDLDHLKIPFAIRGGSTAIMTVICSGDTDIAIRVFGLFNDVPEDKWDAVVKACNFLNKEVRYAKFLLDDDGDVNVEYDVPIMVPATAIGEIVLELFSRMQGILNNHYSVLAKAIFAEDASVHFDFTALHNLLSAHHPDEDLPDDYVDADESE